MRLGFQIVCAQRLATSKSVNYSIDENLKVAKITLTNPKKRNTLSLQTIQQFTSALNNIQQNLATKNIKILRVQAQGTVFSSGHDLKELSILSDPKTVFNSCTELILKIRNFPVPTLCIVNGIAAAAGFQLALSCDLLIASQKSKFSTPGIKWGLFCSTPAVQLLRSINSQKKAMQMLYFGEEISANEAYQYGLLNRVVPQNKIQETANQYITKINSLSGQVIKLGKKVLNSQKNLNVSDAYEIAGKGMCQNISQKQDCKQGLKAFSQKRHPKYKN